MTTATFKPSYKNTLRLVWLAQGTIIAALIALNLAVFWLLNMTWLILPGLFAILVIAIIGSLLMTPLLARLQTVEVDAEKIVTLGMLKPMFTMRWEDIHEVRAGQLLGLRAVSLINKQTGKQVGFYLLTENLKELGEAIMANAPDGNPLRRYAEAYLR